MADAQFGFTTDGTVGYVVWCVIISLWAWLLKNYQTIGKLGGIPGHRLEDHARFQLYKDLEVKMERALLCVRCK